jgi:predicted Rossmann fold flavoprotein
MNEPDNLIWDVVVIGGGPAGMIAAGKAAELGAKVLLLEKNESLGKKLLITGGGRSNVTNAEPDLRTLLSKFRDAREFLFSPFSQFNNFQAIEFFNSHGMTTKVENENRVFPLSNSAQSVWDTLVQYMSEGGVTILSNTPAEKFVIEDNTIKSVKLKNGKEMHGRNFILATGGTSRPETGSTGDGYIMLRDIGHTVIEPVPSLVPVAIDDAWVKAISGVTLPDIKITVFQNDIKQVQKRGKLLFTHFGLSGPTILNMSKDIDELLKYDDVHLSLDILPNEDFSTLNTKLQELFKLEDKKKFKNALSSLIPSALVSAVVELSGIDPEKQSNGVSREERISLMKLLKDMRVRVSGLLGADKAIVSSGGVLLEEIDTKTFASKLFPNLYAIGDVLNINRPTGGYSLQLAWTSGYVAGTDAAKASS